MAPYRTYAMAFTLPRGTLPDALYWDMADPYHYVRLNPGPGTTDYLIAGGADHKSGEADDGDVRFEAIEAWIRSLVPELGKEVHRWSGQVLDTIDYCGFIGRNPGSEQRLRRHRRFRPGHDARRARRHAAQGPDPDRARAHGKRSTIRRARRQRRSCNYVSENVTAIKNFAEHLMPGELDCVDELKPGEGGIVRNGMSRVAACRDRDGKLHVALGGLHASRLPCALEFDRAVLGLPLPRLAVRAGRRGAERTGHCPAGEGGGTGRKQAPDRLVRPAPWRQSCCAAAQMN